MSPDGLELTRRQWAKEKAAGDLSPISTLTPVICDDLERFFFKAAITGSVPGLNSLGKNHRSYGAGVSA
jgi:hypothetical protein